MLPRAPLIVCLLAAVSFAGCVGADDPAPVDAMEDATDEVMEDVPVVLDDRAADDVLRANGPDWVAGDTFTWSVFSAFADPVEVTTVVVADNGGHYELGYTDLEDGLSVQYHHSVPGPHIRKDDGAWVAHGSAFGVIPFPIEDGDTWTVDMWHMEGLQATATAMDLPGPDGEEAMFMIEAVHPDRGLQYRMAWSPRLESVTGIALFFGGDEPWVGAQLVDHGTGHTDAVHVIAPVGDGFYNSWMPGPDNLLAGQTGVQPRHEFDVPAGTTHLAYTCSIGGGPGLYQITLVSPHGHEDTCQEQRTSNTGHSMQARWMVTAEGTHEMRMVAGTEGFVGTEVLALVVEEAMPLVG